MAEWFESFFGPLYAETFLNLLPAAVSEGNARTVQELLELRPGDRVLDVPCGNGRVTLPMARKGLAMTGVDLVPAFVEEASRRAAQEGLDAHFLCGDMRQIAFREEFDAVLNWGDSFGYFSDDEILGFCVRVCQALRPGGWFLVECANRTWLKGSLRPERELAISRSRIRQAQRYDDPSRRLLATWTYTQPEGSETCEFSMRVYNGTEMRALLRGAGLRGTRLFQSYPTFGPFTARSQRFIAVARRPQARKGNGGR